MSQALFLPPGGRASPGGWGGFRVLALGGWLGLVGALVPAAAWACPSCTARAPESPGGAGELLLALMLVPFALVGVGLWAARRAGREAPGAARASAPVEQEHP
ncbi:MULTISPECIES: hypothetical protein [unclassified Corallococcus]|uniref:hypothetical protein n=1 Tax=unclassified Corallococcus TaxID=2685029 RepID=UPI001A8FFC41|nr:MULTISPECIES: hypothetical protein [unclassified Corallococcus]MBN9681540.1 hypothetical protein [Corallococcus sp. NCSPR001]WAS86884.1 hypothetical protein O0N60_07885 [Corallococcus sp. NCRR]